MVAVADGCSSLANRNLPASFWNSNYVPPVPAPTHHQVNEIHFISIFRLALFSTSVDAKNRFYCRSGTGSIFSRRKLFNWSVGATRSPLWFVCACGPCSCRPSTRLSSQYGTIWQLTEVTATLRTQFKVIFISPFTPAPNECPSTELIFNSFIGCCVCRLHHDQQTAHALESAAAYSSYPTMAGKYLHNVFDFW